MTTEEQILARLSVEYEKHCADINNLYAWLSKREGKYISDDTAKAWTQLILHNYSAASALHFVRYGELPADGSLPGVDFVPGKPSYTGKTS